MLQFPPYLVLPQVLAPSLVAQVCMLLAPCHYRSPGSHRHHHHWRCPCRHPNRHRTARDRIPSLPRVHLPLSPPLLYVCPLTQLSLRRLQPQLNGS